MRLVGRLRPDSLRGWKICTRGHGGLKRGGEQQGEPDGGGEAHAAFVTSKTAPPLFGCSSRHFCGVAVISHISMTFHRTGFYAIGHARPLRPNQRMDHFYILTAIDRASWSHKQLRGSCSPMIRPMSYIENEETQVLASRHLRPYRWGTEMYKSSGSY